MKNNDWRPCQETKNPVRSVVGVKPVITLGANQKVVGIKPVTRSPISGQELQKIEVCKQIFTLKNCSYTHERRWESKKNDKVFHKASFLEREFILRH